MLAHSLCVMWSVYVWCPCLVAGTIVYQPHTCSPIDELRGMSTPIWMIGSWYLHYRSPKTEARSVPVSINIPMVHHWGVVWLVWVWSPYLVLCAIVYQPHITQIDELRGISTPLYGWLEFIVYHTSSKAEDENAPVRTVKLWYLPQGSIYWYMQNHMIWMYCHPFHMSYGCMER